MAVLGVTDPQILVMLRARARALRRTGWRVVLICSPGPLLEQVAREEGVEHRAIPMCRAIAPLSDFISLCRLWRALRTLHPDLAEFSTPKAGLLGNIAALLCRVPARVYVLRGMRLETTTGVKRKLLTWTERIASACSHLVLCNSASLRHRALTLAIAPEVKLRMLARGSSNGVDCQRFAPGAESARLALGIPRGAPVIGFVGRLTRDKGIPDLIPAFESVLRNVPSAWLLLVGRFDDSVDMLSPGLRRRIEAHPRIIHTGYVADPAPYYRAMDLLVLPTWREGFPNVALEAAASGVPVITTRVTGARDAVLDGHSGLLIPPGDSAAIAGAVVRLLEKKELRVAMGLAGRRWVMHNFDEERVLGLTVSLYSTLLDGRGSSRVSVPITDAAAAAD